DTFVWMLDDVGGDSFDTVIVFSVNGGDVLDLSDVIDGAPTSLDGVVQFTESTEGTTLSLNVSGQFVDVALFQGKFGFDADEMLADGVILA
ncbi:MAG: type I secretion C-terminal target domain-containing protein, partial [Pseudomonadota bacterium]